ncbi:MAG: transposase [Chloroflexota bacterium]
MAKFKPCNDNQLIMLPISLQEQLVPGSLEYTISEVEDKHMNRFTLRTKRKVDMQWRLYAMVHNIGKIHAFGRLN